MGLPMKRLSVCPLALVLVALAAHMTTGCAVVLMGVGAGAAATAYVMGKLTQTYESGYSEALQASTDTLSTLKIAVVERVGGEYQTTIKARQPDETPVEIEVERIEANRTDIGIRTGHVGVWDYETSRQIHDLIGERLAQHKTSRATASNQACPPPAKLPVETPAAIGAPEPVKKKAVARAVGPAPTPASRGATGFNPDLTVFFASGADEVAPGENQKLDRVAAMLRDHPGRVVSLHGYSDAGGNPGQNFILSVRRADAVKRYLADRGCPEDRVLIIGHGSAKFLGTNDTAAGRRLNRRVEIEIHHAP
jgi:outer membrane protein OmpA-like peptidoglycan-associated protein